MALLERSEPLASLATSWSSAQAGHGAVVLIEGEAGIGKTSLVRELASGVAAPARSLLGACDALSTPRPLGPLHDVAAELSGELARALGESRAPEVIFPLVAADISGTRPTLLVIEDAHWADAATIDLLRFLGRRIRAMRALLVITSRDDEVGPRHPLRVAIGDLASAGELKRIALRPLSADAVAKLAGAGIDSRALHKHTGGNPFYVTEALAAGGGLPQNVRDAVLSRVARLPAAARTTLEAAAVIGASADVALLVAVVGSALSLEQCLQAGLLRPEPSLVVFRHEIARQAVLSALAPDALRRWHARILAALRKQSAVDLATLAHHAAGALDGPAVLEIAPAAARQAASMRSHREAASQFSRALAFAGALPRAERADLLEAYSYECYVTDQTAEAIRSRTEAAALREALGDALRHGDDLRWLSRYQWWAGNRPAAEAAGERAVELLEALEPGRELAAAWSNLSQLCMLAAQGEASIRWGRKALALARRLGDENVEAHALNNIGTSRLNAVNSRGWVELRKSLELSLARGFEDHAARAYNNLAHHLVTQRKLAEADRLLRDGIAYDYDRGLDGHRAYLLGLQAMLRLHQGKLDAAIESAQLALSDRQLSTILRVNPLCVIGRVRARRGDPEVWRPLDEALELAERTRELQRIGPARIARSEAAWLEGDDARAREEAERALPLALDRCESGGWTLGELLLCLRRAGGKLRAHAWCPQPIRDQLQGRAARAERTWRKLLCPFDAALALAGRGGEDSLRRAFSELEQLGMRAAAARVAQSLREIGAHHIPRGRRASTSAHPKGLTAREVEILDLLAEGLRNAEIGRRLFISPKTVDHHVSAILEKLGVRDRAEAAKWRRNA